MQFQRSKISKIIIIAASILILLGAGVWVYFAKFSADELSDDSFSEGIAVQNNNPTVIKMPAKYSLSQLNNAGEVSKSTKSAIDNEIIQEVNKQIQEIAKNAPQIYSKTIDGKIQYYDLVFTVADSKGQFATPKTAKKTASKVAADNFIFSDTTPESLRQKFIDNYPKIEKIYGARSDSDPIKVVVEPGVGRAYYNSFLNEIHIYERDDFESSAIHEMVHAFHHRFCLLSSWEEGMAQEVTGLVLNSSVADWAAELGYQDAEVLNGTDADVSEEMNNPWVNITPYTYGARTMDILYSADNNFFKSFNAILYSSSNWEARYSNAQLVRWAAKSTAASIEGKSVVDWFSAQNALIPFYQASDSLLPEMYYAYAPAMDQSNNSFSYVIKTNYPLKSGNFSTKITYADGTVAANEENCIDNWRGDNFIFKNCRSNDDNFAEYEGVFNVLVTPTSNPDNTKTVKMLRKPNLYGTQALYVVSQTKGELLKVTRLSTGENQWLRITNGMYKLDNSEWLSVADDFKIEEYALKANCNSSNISSCAGNKIYENQIHRPRFQSQKPMITYSRTGNDCSPKVSGIVTTNHSITANASSGINCNAVFQVNNIPISRFWGQKTKYQMRNLKKGSKYTYGFLFSSAKSASKKIRGSFSTSNYPDLTLLSVENTGNFFDNTFSSKLTYNIPIARESVALRYCEDGMMISNCIDTDVVFNDSRTITIKPKQKLQNNNWYVINGIDLVLDEQSNPVYYINWNNAYFEAPINPDGAEEPKFSLKKSVYGADENILVTKNFVSDELVSKLDSFKISYFDPEADIYKIIACNVSIEGNDIVIKHSEPLLSGVTYSLTTPSLIDNLNNKVLDAWLNFTIE